MHRAVRINVYFSNLQPYAYANTKSLSSFSPRLVQCSLQNQAQKWEATAKKKPYKSASQSHCSLSHTLLTPVIKRTFFFLHLWMCVYMMICITKSSKLSERQHMCVFVICIKNRNAMQCQTLYLRRECATQSERQIYF